jgi:hypothetical protein
MSGQHFLTSLDVCGIHGLSPISRSEARALQGRASCGTRQAFDEAKPHGIGHSHENNRNAGSCRFQVFPSPMPIRRLKFTGSALRALIRIECFY